ncbi:hypothetical protein [Methanoregula sp.]|uniref:hypothetical protein n=1 Tax=Methanoregula sp. TaxID=2052170 RepID=UPI003C72D936
MTGFTIFIIAFIYVATLIPGLLLNLQNTNIDYNAVAYRTGVILTEDSGSPVSWENPALYTDYFIQNGATGTRLGLALSSTTPNVLSFQKINRFYCSTLLAYPGDYRSKAVFGDYPYLFNISLQITGENTTRAVGDVVPDEYGYIRRVVKVKGFSNVTIGQQVITNLNMVSTDNVTIHNFLVQFNSTDLLANSSNPACKSPLYQINPWQDQMVVNLTDLQKTMGNANTNASLVSLTILAAQQSQPFPVPVAVTKAKFNSATNMTGLIPPLFLYVDGNSTPVTTLPVNVSSNLSLFLSPGYFYNMGYNTANQQDMQTQMYVEYTFQLTQPDHYLNNTVSGSFPYTYSDVTPASLNDGVMEIEVW